MVGTGATLRVAQAGAVLRSREDEEVRVVVRHATIGRRSSGSAGWALLLVLGLLAALPLAAAAADTEGSRGSDPSTGGAARQKHKHKPEVTRFTVSTFNVLGNRHTAKG